MSLSSASLRLILDRVVITFAVLFLGGLFTSKIALAQSSTLLEWSEDGLGIVLDSNSSSEAQVTINIGDGSLRATFAVDNPSRIVLDLTKVTLKGSRSVKVARPALIRGIRLGVHKDQVRVVLDCEGERSPKFAVEGSTGSIRVTLRALQGAQPVVESTPIAPTIAPTVAAKATVEQELISGTVSSASTIPTTTQDVSSESEISQSSVSSEPASSSVSVSSTPTQLPALTIEAAPTAVATATQIPRPSATHTPIQNARALSTQDMPAGVLPSSPPTPLVGSPTPAMQAIEVPRNLVRGIIFDEPSADSQPALRIVLSSRSQFTLLKMDDKNYELNLPGFTLEAPHLSLPQFPTDNFTGITFVSAASSAAGIRIKIGVDRGTRLSAIMRGLDLVIRPQ